MLRYLQGDTAMKTALVMLVALGSMTIWETAANSQAGSKLISLAQAMATNRIAVMPVNKERGRCQLRKLRTAMLAETAATRLT